MVIGTKRSKPTKHGGLPAILEAVRLSSLSIFVFTLLTSASLFATYNNHRSRSVDLPNDLYNIANVMLKLFLLYIFHSCLLFPHTQGVQPS